MTIANATAFPHDTSPACLTKREYFASHVMMVLAVSSARCLQDEEALPWAADIAVRAADALINALNEPAKVAPAAKRPPAETDPEIVALRARAAKADAFHRTLFAALGCGSYGRVLEEIARLKGGRRP